MSGDVDFDFEDAVFDFLLRYDGERDCVAALAAVGRYFVGERGELADFDAAPAVFFEDGAQLALVVEDFVAGEFDGFDEEGRVFLGAGVALAVVLVGLDFFLLDFDVGFAGAHVGRVGAHGFLVEGGQRRGREGRRRREREQAD